MTGRRSPSQRRRDAANAVPQGAHILAAFLYWQTVESATSAPASGILSAVTPCWARNNWGVTSAFTMGPDTAACCGHRIVSRERPGLPAAATRGLVGRARRVSMPAGLGQRAAARDWRQPGGGLPRACRTWCRSRPSCSMTARGYRPVLRCTMNQDIRGFYEAAPGPRWHGDRDGQSPAARFGPSSTMPAPGALRQRPRRGSGEPECRGRGRDGPQHAGQRRDPMVCWPVGRARPRLPFASRYDEARRLLGGSA